MKDILLYNTRKDKFFPSDYLGVYHVHILCHKGNAQFRMNEKSFSIEPNDFVIWQIGSDVYEFSYSADFDADFLIVARNFLIENNPENVWATKAYVYIKQNPVFHLLNSEKSQCESDFLRFREMLAKPIHLFQKEILGKQLQIFLLDLWDIYAREINRQIQLSNTSANLFHRFMDLVRQYAIIQREVAFYAERLCITPKYLSEIVTKGSGKPASYWINGYATQEVVALLKRMDISLAEIVECMNFSSLSHLSRFTKRMLGVSPSDYRKRMNI